MTVPATILLRVPESNARCSRSNYGVSSVQSRLRRTQSTTVFHVRILYADHTNPRVPAMYSLSNVSRALMREDRGKTLGARAIWILIKDASVLLLPRIRARIILLRFNRCSYLAHFFFSLPGWDPVSCPHVVSMLHDATSYGTSWTNLFHSDVKVLSRRKTDRSVQIEFRLTSSAILTRVCTFSYFYFERKEN